MYRCARGVAAAIVAAAFLTFCAADVGTEPAPAVKPAHSAAPRQSFDIEFVEAACLGESDSVEIAFRVKVLNQELLAGERAPARVSVLHEPGVAVADVALDRRMRRVTTNAAASDEPARLPNDPTAYVQSAVADARIADLAAVPSKITLERSGTTWGNRVAIVVDLPGSGRVMKYLTVCGRDVAANATAPLRDARLGVKATISNTQQATGGVSAFGALTINWTMQYSFAPGIPAPIRYGWVEVWDEDTLSADDLLFSGQTDHLGRISSTVDNSDESGTLDLYVRVWLENGAVKVADINDYGWYLYTDPVANMSDGTYNWTLTLDYDESGAFYIYDAIVFGWQYVTTITSAPPKVNVRWPADGSYYTDSIHITGGGDDPDEYDDAVILHEYGHFIDDIYGGSFVPDYGDDNAHFFDSHENAPTAFGEGWASFFGSAARRWAGYGNSHLYISNTVTGAWWFDLENGYNFTGTGDSDVEGSVCTILWDIFDPNNDTGDILSDGVSRIWTVFDAGTGNDTLFTFWDQWESRGFGNLVPVAEIYWNHRAYEAVDDLQNPVATITGPTSSSSYGTTLSSINLSGNASDNQTLTRVECSNAATGVTVAATGVSNWSCTLSLNLGTNNITVRAYDRKGRSGTDTLSVNRTQDGGDVTAPSVSITTPTSSTTYATANSLLNLGGTASDNSGVTQVTWSNNRGGSGTASGTTSWSVSSIVLQAGENILTVTAHDAANNTATDTLSVTYSVSSGSGIRGDFNGDGYTDVFWQNRVTYQNYLWYMNQNTLISGANVNNNGAGWKVMTTADFDGNGTPDLLYQQESTKELRMWFMSGNLATGIATPPNPGANWNVVAAADFNSDGRADILFQNSATNQLYLWYMNGAAVITGANVNNVGANWRVAGAADFNADTKPDIVWRNAATGQNYLWYMNANAKIGEANISAEVNTNWAIVAVADFSADNKPDLLWQYGPTGQIVLWVMNNNQQMQQRNMNNVGSADWKVAGPK